MKRILFSALLAGSIAIASFSMTAPSVSAEGLDTTPPEIGLVMPTTFAVNHLITISVDVNDNGGLNGCYLFVNAKDKGSMTVRDGHASLTQVFETPETRYVQVRCSDMAGNQSLSPVTEIRAETPETAILGGLPIGFSPGMLVHLSCLPDEANDEHCNDVYYVGRDAKRHAFQSVPAFLSWYPDGGSVMRISLAALSSLPLGSPISIKPGQNAIRFLSQSMVYAVTGPLKLRPFANESVATSALGSNWNSRIDVLTDAYYGNFIFGPELTNTLEISHTLSTPDDVIGR